MMNEPIINPWFFYFASRANVVIVIATIVIIVGVAMIVAYASVKYFEEGEFPILLRAGIALSIASCLVLLVVPSEQTIYKMMLAHYATPDNINDVVELIVDGARRIAEATNG